jgi:preprotein translocase subunit SecD
MKKTPVSCLLILSLAALSGSAADHAIFRLMLGKKKVIDQNDVQTVVDIENPEASEWEIVLTLNPKGTERLAKATRENIGKKMRIVVDGRTVSAPEIMAPIESGKVAFSGHAKEDADRLVERIRTALPSTPRSPEGRNHRTDQ